MKRPRVLLVSDAAAQAIKWLYSLIHRASINNVCQAFSIF